MRKSKINDFCNEENGFCCSGDSICSYKANHTTLLLSIATLGILGILGAVALSARSKKSLITL